MVDRRFDRTPTSKTQYYSELQVELNGSGHIVVASTIKPPRAGQLCHGRIVEKFGRTIEKLGRSFEKLGWTVQN